MGARPLGRVIQQEIKKPLADHLLFGDLITGGHVKVDVVDGKPTFAITPAKPKKEGEAHHGEDSPDAADGDKEPVSVK
jgi:ATP-dependent Clp protease ATP-binding subunit ClpA